MEHLNEAVTFLSVPGVYNRVLQGTGLIPFLIICRKSLGVSFGQRYNWEGRDGKRTFNIKPRERSRRMYIIKGSVFIDMMMRNKEIF